MIEVNHLSKCFGANTVVNDLSFTVAEGEVLGFLGPNGAGKSTTMKMLTGFLAPDSGEIRICGLDVSAHPIAVKQQLGYLPEGAPCYGDMSVQQFLKFIAKVRGFNHAEQKRRVDAVVERLQLQGVTQQSIDTLSKGFKRRVGLAQAIIHDPKVLILDEPTDGLDPNQKHQVRELIENLSKDKILIISTHILEEVSAVCSRAVIINRGTIVADSTPAELQARSRYCGAVSLHLNVDAATVLETVLDKLNALENVQSVEHQAAGSGNAVATGQRFIVFPKSGREVFSALNDLVREQQWQVSELSVDAGRLDDVFRQITGDVQQ